MTVKTKFSAAIASLGLVFTAATLAATPAAARDYDGYCYQKETAPRTKGTIIGALSGAAVGNIIAGDGNKTEGTLLGAAVGAAIGNAVGNEQKKKDKYTGNANCYNGRYYVYGNSRYDPPPPPRGYRVAYFYDRPNYKTVYVYRNGREEVYDRHRHGGTRR